MYFSAGGRLGFVNSIPACLAWARPALPEAQPMADVAARDLPAMQARRGGRGGGQVEIDEKNYPENPACPVKYLPNEMFALLNVLPVQPGRSLFHRGEVHLTGVDPV